MYYHACKILLFYVDTFPMLNLNFYMRFLRLNKQPNGEQSV